MVFSVERLKPDQSEYWDRFVQKSNEGTLFHRLSFLAYHGERFARHEHHVVIYKGNCPHALMPLALLPTDDGMKAKSPYLASYGGPVFERVPTYSESRAMVTALLEYLSDQQVMELHLTLPIAACYRRFDESFRLVLLENGFKCVNRDISSAVFLDRSQQIDEIVTSRTRNMVRKASQFPIECKQRVAVADFWTVLQSTYEKHGASPTHSLEELRWLMDNLPDSVYVDVAYLEGRPVAGIGYFVANPRVNSSFYLCQDPEHQQTQSLSLLIYQALARARDEGFAWFDFGTSSVGMVGREGVFRFKESFGARGLFRETYLWSREA